MAMSQAEKAMVEALGDLNREAYNGRDAEILDELSSLKPNQRKHMSFKQGSRVYKKQTPESFLKLIRTQPLMTAIEVLGADDNRLLAVQANRAINIISTYALGHRETGAHMESLTVFIRAVGARNAKEHRGVITARDLPDRAVISIVPIIKYASALESMLYAGSVGGLMYMAAKAIERGTNKQIAVKYDYVAGERVGENGGTFPRIELGFHGNVKRRFKTPGSRAKRAGRTYAQAKGRSS